jgi:hypothetical protein
VVQAQHPTLCREPAEHDLVRADQVEGRLVVGEGAGHVLEHGLDRADADLVPVELGLDAGQGGKRAKGCRQVLERPPVFLIDPNWAAHADLSERVER